MLTNAISDDDKRHIFPVSGTQESILVISTQTFPGKAVSSLDGSFVKFI